MRVVDLTLPLYDFMPVGNVWAWDVPFQSRPITTWEQNGYELTMLTMHSEAGTRLMIRAMTHGEAPRIDQLPLEPFVLRPTAVLETPCGIGGVLEPADIDRAFQDADVREGDAVLLHTGWGDDRRWVELGDDYARRTPYVSKAAAERLVEHLRATQSDLVGADVAYWGRGDRYQGPEWADRPAWERAPFPSIQARRYLAGYTREKALADFESPAVLTAANVNFIGALCNLGGLSRRRVELIVLPLKVQGARGATCRVVAVER
jgi:kynurenine formamidase